MNELIEENYSITILRHAETGMRVREIWNTDNKKHRLDGPAERVWNEQTGKLVMEAYFVNGRGHRERQPYMRRWDKTTGHLITEVWAQLGTTLRNPNLPSIIEYDPQTGAKTEERFFDMGLQGRENGPAEIKYDPVSTKKIFEAWMINDVLSRYGGLPAYIAIDPNSDVIFEEEYYEDGFLHRSNGPARIVRNIETGQIELAEHYIKGCRLDKNSKMEIPDP